MAQKTKNKKSFAVFILTYGRPDNVITYETLIQTGYTGPVYFICSDDDKKLDEYQSRYKNVVVFSKHDYLGKYDAMDNFKDMRVVYFARNACFDIAKNLGVDYFLALDDDYSSLEFKIPTEKKLYGIKPENINKVFSAFLEYMETTPTEIIAFGQGGDYIGGVGNNIFTSIGKRRKMMNSFFCRADGKTRFIGTINEDTTTYVNDGRTGVLFITNPLFSLTQIQTQSNPGGLTDIYLDKGTFYKSFYTIIANPSSVTVSLMGKVNKRLHHNVKWDNTVPMIIREEWKKP